MTGRLTSRTAAAILKDETEHLAEGVERIRAFLDSDRRGTHDSLVWAHHKVMPQFFQLIRYGCESLCDELGLQCETLNLDAFEADIDALRIRALEHYVENLESVGFDPDVVSSLIASMASYHEQFSAHLFGAEILNLPGTGCKREGCC